MAATSHLMTVEEFGKLPEDAGPVYHELRHGELPFRALPEHEVRAADVACLSNQRWDGISADDHLRGAPDLIIEVLSPSNTASEIFDKERLCLENGSKEFWVVDPERRQVKVSTVDGHTVTYRAGQRMPVAMFGAELDGRFDFRLGQVRVRNLLRVPH